MFLVSGDRSRALLVIAGGRGAARLREPLSPTRAAHAADGTEPLTPGRCHGLCHDTQQHCLPIPGGRETGWLSNTWWWRLDGFWKGRLALRYLCQPQRWGLGKLSPVPRGSCFSADLQTMLSFGRKHCPLPPVESEPLAKVEKPEPAQQAWPRVTFLAYGLDHGCLRPGLLLQAFTGLKTGPHCKQMQKHIPGLLHKPNFSHWCVY